MMQVDTFVPTPLIHSHHVHHSPSKTQTVDGKIISNRIDHFQMKKANVIGYLTGQHLQLSLDV